MIRPLSLVKFDFSSVTPLYRKVYSFKENDRYIFLGEIPNMPGHCVVIEYNKGKIYSGYHTSNFIELSEEET